MYILRDVNGIMKAQFPERLAVKIIMNGIGCWKPLSNGKQGFVFENDLICTIPDTEIKLFFWNGDYLYSR